MNRSSYSRSRRLLRALTPLVTMALAAACVDDSAGGRGDDLLGQDCEGAKCSDPNQVLECAPHEGYATPLEDSGICEILDETGAVAISRDDPYYRNSFFTWTDSVCRAFVPGSSPACDSSPHCVRDLDLAGLRTELGAFAELSDPELCYRVSVAQHRCRENAQLPADAEFCEQSHGCIEGLEVGCQQYVPPWIRDAGSTVPLPASRCTGQTVGGLGFSPVATYPQQIDSCQAQGTGEPYGECMFMGQRVVVAEGYCDILTQCVEPKLACLESGNTDDYFVGTTLYQAPIYDFPSGAQSLRIDLSCVEQRQDCIDIDTTQQACPDECVAAGGCGSRGNHSTLNGCRALDLDVTANGGNLSGGVAEDPEAAIAPEFVAVMEECGLIWGGRFNGTVELPEIGCDPMHFDYAPSCIPAERRGGQGASSLDLCG